MTFRFVRLVPFGLALGLLASDASAQDAIGGLAPLAERLRGTGHDFAVAGGAENACGICHGESGRAATGSAGCVSCHGEIEAGMRVSARAGRAVSPFEPASDHPVGRVYPSSGMRGARDYRQPDFTDGNVAFFDVNGNGRIDPEEVRLYRSVDGDRVECGSCHDPHGTTVVDPGPRDRRAMLRRGDPRTGLCRNCHNL